MAVFSVSAFSSMLQSVIGEHFSTVSIQGEISSLKRHSSGHVYFSLRDTTAVLDAICWKGMASKMEDHLQEGLEVVCHGRLTTYPMRSKYQIIVESMESAGVGALLKLLEERKSRLKAMGLFESSRKKNLPNFPQSLGIITSPTGAVIQDILHRLNDRFPLSVFLWPTAVQGEGASRSIIKAIQSFNAMKSPPDVLIIARGGGSLEDLWCFNDEDLALCVASSKIPIISAVGHETDYTLIDFVADLRAPTPTAAAELVTPHKQHLLETINGLYNNIVRNLQRMITLHQMALKDYSRWLSASFRVLERPTQLLDDQNERLHIAISSLINTYLLENKSSRLTPLIIHQMIYTAQKELDRLSEKLFENITSFLKAWEGYLNRQEALLNGLSYSNTLKRGFALVCDQKNKPITHLKHLHVGQEVTLKIYDGQAHLLVKKITS